MPRLREFRWGSWAEWASREFRADAPTMVAVDTETSGVGFYDEPFAATLTWRGADGSMRSAYFDLEADGAQFRSMLLGGTLRATPAWVFHNAKFDLQKLLLAGVITWDDLRVAELHDTQTIYALLDENGRKGLKHLAVTVLGVDDTFEVEIKSGPNKGQTKRVPKEEHRLAAARRKLGLKKEDGYHLLPRDVLIPYALRDTEFTLQLFEALMPRLEKLGDPKVLDLYRHRMRLKLALLRMESNGFGLDLPYLQTTTSEYGARVMEGWQRVVEITGKPDLNPQSPAQLKEAFAALGVHVESTDVHALRELVEAGNELAEAILAYRQDAKLHKTYLKALLSEQRDGIAHPNFNDDATRTGRMSSSSAKE